MNIKYLYFKIRWLKLWILKNRKPKLYLILNFKKRDISLKYNTTCLPQTDTYTSYMPKYVFRILISSNLICSIHLELEYIAYNIYNHTKYNIFKFSRYVWEYIFGGKNKKNVLLNQGIVQK